VSTSAASENEGGSERQGTKRLSADVAGNAQTARNPRIARRA